MVNLTQLTAEEKLLTARVEDLAYLALSRGNPQFSSFFNEREQMLAKQMIEQHKLEGASLWGGYPDALRQMVGFFPHWKQPENTMFPLEAIAIHLPKDAAPSHRDVLGSLMALQIAREGIGDILIDLSERRCGVFVQENLVPVVLEELTRIGNFGVRCEISTKTDYERNDPFLALRGTVSSLRMDALVSVLTGVSRKKSLDLLQAEQVLCNYQRMTKPSTAFSSQDVITIRGYGKYTIDEIGSPTKKGRFPVWYKKYI